MFSVKFLGKALCPHIFWRNSCDDLVHFANGHAFLINSASRIDVFIDFWDGRTSLMIFSYSLGWT